MRFPEVWRSSETCSWVRGDLEIPTWIVHEITRDIPEGNSGKFFGEPKENYSHSALDETRGNPFAAVLCQKTTLKWGNPAGPVPRCFRCWGQILRILETLHTRPTHGLPAGLCCIDAGMIMMWGRSSGGEWMRVCGVRSRAPRIRSDAVTSELSETRPGVLCPSPPWPRGT